jgi:hypothetical protein
VLSRRCRLTKQSRTCLDVAAFPFLKLPSQFSLGPLNKKIVASNALPVGFVYRLTLQIGANTETSRDDFFEYDLRNRNQL